MHLLKLADDMYEYAMDLASIMVDMEQMWFCLKTHGLTDGQYEICRSEPQTYHKTHWEPDWTWFCPWMDKQTTWNQ